MSKTSDDYRPCIVVFPNGQTRKSNVLYVRMYFKWDMREQQYKELKEKYERDAAVKPGEQS